MGSPDEEKKMDYDIKEQNNFHDNAAQQRAVIRELDNEYHTPKRDETWCLIDAKWYSKWKKWVCYEAKTMDFEHKDPICDQPGPIDNSHLLIDNTRQLRKDLITEEDYTFIHEKVWYTLCDWYTGGPCIARQVVERGRMKDLRIDLFPLFLKWGYADDSQPDGLPKDEDQKVTLVCQSLEVKDVREIFEQKDAGDIPGAKSEVRLNMRLEVINRVKNRFPNPSEEERQRYVELSPEDDLLMLEEFKLEDGDLHLVVAQEKDGKWSYLPREPFEYLLGDVYDIRDSKKIVYQGFIIEHLDGGAGDMVHYINWPDNWNEIVTIEDRETRILKRGSVTNGYHIPGSSKQASASATTNPSSTDTTGYYSVYSGGYNQNEKGKSVCKGIVGLRNLGNTCFMNSTLQCLMQSPWLSKFFLTDGWKRDLNRNNPLGKDGRVAEQYGALVDNIFSGDYRVVGPRDFKKVIGEFAPRFVGWQQQDSQELLAFLLDGLHEDLNRVKVKPYTNNVESNGREDNVVANETWETYLKRNDSIIVDKLQGQYKSKLVCPCCGRTSIIFDPFMYLTVPLPIEKHKIVPVTVVLGNGIPPKKYGIKVLKEADVGDMKKIIGTQFGIDPKWIVVADIWKNKLHRYISNLDRVSMLRSNDDIWVYDATPKDIRQNEKENSPMNLDEPDADLGEPVRGLDEPEGEPDRISPTYLISEIQHVAKTQNYSYYYEENVGIPLIITIAVTDTLTFANVCDQLCAVLEHCVQKPTEEDMDEDFKEDNNPYRITYQNQEEYRYTLGSNKDLIPSDEIFDFHRKIKFTVHWKTPSRLNTKMYLECEKDESFPSVDSDDSVGAVPLSSCLDAFTEEEILTQDNAWYCSKCGKFQRASKKIDLWRLPDLLIIHLKRFSFDRVYRQKINFLVNFPLKNLDLKNWVSPSCRLDQSTTYDLYGASMHSGVLGAGHYTALVQSLVSGDWYHMNDSSVSTARGEDTQSPAAYLLFYKNNKHSSMFGS